MAIKACGGMNCKNDFQDKKYGAGMRVMNECKSASGAVKHRCTVCLAEKGGDGSGKKK